ncbi:MULTISPECIES: hypothetical protein [Parabacteroides]|nr:MULTISPECIES: hypothetical protein [Parabacteroides]MCS2892228.1 hypothetical protein [Parabacteroides faecis]UVQ49134.1 hypothetical protein NXY11_13265 [Parabacteroides faecis]
MIHINMLGGYTFTNDRLGLSSKHNNKIAENGTDKKNVGVIMVL